MSLTHMTYDMTILMCAQKLTDASLICRTGPKTKTSKMKKLKNKRICSEAMVPGKKPWSQSGKREGKSKVEMICGTGRF